MYTVMLSDDDGDWPDIIYAGADLPEPDYIELNDGSFASEWLENPPGRSKNPCLVAYSSNGNYCYTLQTKQWEKIA